MDLFEKTGDKILGSLEGVGGTLVTLFRGLYWFKQTINTGH